MESLADYFSRNACSGALERDEALRMASFNGLTDVVKALVGAGANVHAYGDGSLRMAARNGHTDVVAILLSAGADVRSYRNEALRLAAENGHTDIVSMLQDWIGKGRGGPLLQSTVSP